MLGIVGADFDPDDLHPRLGHDVAKAYFKSRNVRD
jgi:hypothetical protein